MDGAGTDTAFWRRVRHALEEALEREGAQRERFLEGHCAGDAELRAEVDRLLALESSPGPDLDPPTPTAFQGWVPGTGGAPQQRVGPYQLVRELGSGGMGTVWLAERTDGAFSRRVAIKVLRPGLATAAVLARFQRERQLLAELDHPGIARMYEGGATDDGLPYLVMEHVEGLPIDRFADERRLTTRGRVELFRKVCAAVHGAHQRLIVHRDLKPSNVLVTAGGEPRLLDFGIAKMLDADGDGAEATHPEHRPMTPAYASPEQVAGEAITTASDVYSLGVVLYRLLTGDLPHRVDTTSLTELERILTREPRRPSAAVARADETVARARRTTPRGLQRQLEGDLDHVVLAALRRDPRRRYASVAELSDDLARHLEGLPVRARPDTLAYRASKFVARNRLAVGAAALVFALLSAGLAFSTVQYRRADEAGRLESQARELAERRLEEVRRLNLDLEGQRAETERRLVEVEGLNVRLEEQRAEAEARFQDAYELARTLTLDVGRDLLPIQGARDVIDRVTTLGQGYLDRLAKRASSDEIARELALSYLRLGDLRSSTAVVGSGSITAAEECVASAVALAEELVERSPDDPANAYVLMQGLIHRSTLARAVGRLDEERRHLERAIAAGDGFARASELKPGFAWALQEALFRLAMHAAQLGDFARGEELLARAGDVLERAPGIPAAARAGELADHDEFRAQLAASRGDPAAALEHHARALGRLQPLLDARPDDVDLRDRDESLRLATAALRLRTGDREGALAMLSECLAGVEATLRADPGNLRARSRAAEIHGHLADALVQGEDLDGAAAAHDDELDARRAVVAGEGRDALARLQLVQGLRRAADTARRRGRHGEVDRLVDEALERAARDPDVLGMGRETSNVLLVRARSLRDRGEPATALHAYDEAIDSYASQDLTWEGDNLPALLDRVRTERAELAPPLEPD